MSTLRVLLVDFHVPGFHDITYLGFKPTFVVWVGFLPMNPLSGYYVGYERQLCKGDCLTKTCSLGIGRQSCLFKNFYRRSSFPKITSKAFARQRKRS